MKKLTFFQGGGYSAPELEILTVAVEQGFAGSFGEEGENPDAGEDNYGDGSGF